MKTGVSRTVALAFALATTTLQADESEPVSVDSNTTAVLDDSPYISARADGMGGALSTIADGIHAPYYNPAGIGGIHWERTRPPLMRQLHFPYVGVGVNENSQKVVKEFNKKGGAADKGVGNSIVDANAGKRQYGRGSVVQTIGVGRTALVTYQDTQVAALKKDGQTSTDGTVTTTYRQQTGAGLGLSLASPQESFYLGLFTSFNNRKVFQGDVSYLSIANIDDRRKTINEGSVNYNGVSTNAGFIWVMGKYARPALAIAVKDAGNTNYAATNAKPGQKEFMVKKEDVTAGISLSPSLGKSGFLNFIIEGQNLTNNDMALNKKFRTALELNLGGFGSEAILGTRVGYNLAGPSFGLNLNLGLIQFEAASKAEDIGVDNTHFAERRNVVVFSVNVQDN